MPNVPRITFQNNLSCIKIIAIYTFKVCVFFFVRQFQSYWITLRIERKLLQSTLLAIVSSDIKGGKREEKIESGQLRSLGRIHIWSKNTLNFKIVYSEFCLFYDGMCDICCIFLAPDHTDELDFV